MAVSLKLILLSIFFQVSLSFLSNDQFSKSQKRCRIRSVVFDAATLPEQETSIDQSEDVILNQISRNSIFNAVAESAALCLLESDKRRDAKAEHADRIPSGVANWINDEKASILQNTIDNLKLKLAEERTGVDRDEASAWIRWMKSTPTPMIIDLSPELRVVANETMSDADFDLIEQSRTEFLARMGAKLILLPSGSTISRPLREPPASLIYGKLLFGGVTRYRLLNSSNSRRPPRKTGERTLTKVSANDNIPSWIQFGGPDRIYESVDMGSAAVLEITMVPRGQRLETDDTANYGDMIVNNCVWRPQDIFGAVRDENDLKQKTDGKDDIDFVSGYTPISQAGKDRNDAFQADFKADVGGLQPQIDAIVRRVLDGRVIRPVGEDDGLLEKDETTTALNVATLEARELAILGLTPVRGLLLYGPPGTGKTLLARQIAKALRARAPKIVSAPELLDRWVG